MQTNIHVGILFSPNISFSFQGEYLNEEWGGSDGGSGIMELLPGGQAALTIDGKTQFVNLPMYWHPANDVECSFELKDVTIGISFHWERKENQIFRGGLKIIADDGLLTAINILPLEEYLKSVISSEMSANSSEALLKAHAVISRSWLMAQIEKEQELRKTGKQVSGYFTDDEHIRWYDREDHTNFHVCADDHCQRYQGITRATVHTVNEAIDQTRGEVLTFGGKICDARYSKCCGGISEVFENVWEPVNHPYLAKVVDNTKYPHGFNSNLNTEGNAVKWIMGSPDAFCNTKDKQVLSQVLNDYDQETFDFYRWRKEYTQDELGTLMYKRIGIDVGRIVDLVPVERGVSGRIIKLQVLGTQKNIIIGKELEIRKAFSPSHLYSSAFVIEKENIVDGIPQKFILTGAGWGHGVGLCQIGAAVMGANGYTYRQILQHYFKGAVLEERY